MRIGCLQFAPVKGDVNNNLSRADGVLLKENPEDLDLLVLPELAFTGYYFKSLNEIFPHLEPTGSGTSSLWARTVALKYDCTVVVGYPEKVDVTNKWPASPEYYNSVIIVDGEGQTAGSYRKSHLYSIDETWALEGQGGFFTGDVAGVKDTVIGISMDITPYRFRTPWNNFEFANRVIQVRSNLVIVTLAWPTNQEGRLFSRTPQHPDMAALMHWLSRLEPIIQKEGDEEVIVVFTNRTGNEDGVVYAGTSAVLGIKGGEVSVYGILGRSDRELLVVDTEKEPYGKLIYRPEGHGMASGGLKPFYNSATIPQLKAASPPVPPPPPPAPGHLRGSRERTEAPAPISGGPSISEVLHAKDSAGTPPSAASPRPPKLSLKTSPAQLEPAFPNVLTPTGPSPTPFSRRPRIAIRPADSWTQRYIDGHMKSPARHPMEINPPPAQILGGEVAILQSPLYSATDGPMVRPWDSPGFSKPEPSPVHSGSTEFTGLSSTKASSIRGPSQRYDAQSGSNATARRQTPGRVTGAFVTPPALTTTAAPPISNVIHDAPNIQRTGQSEAAGCHKVDTPATDNGPSKVVEGLQRFALQEKPPAVSPPPLLPLTYSPPKAQRVEDLSRSKPTRVRNSSCHESPRREPRPNATGSSASRFRSESCGGTERGRSTGPHHPAIQLSSRTTTPSNKNREQSRGRSRTHKYREASPAPGPSSRQESRSESVGQIDLSQFRLVEEHPSPSCAIHGTRSRSASQGQIPRRTSASPSTHNRSASSRRQRPLRNTPIMSNVRTNVEKTRPSVPKITTKLGAAVFNPSPIAGPKPRSPAKREQQGMSVVRLSPKSPPISPTVSPYSFGSAAFYFEWTPERKSWVESWLPTLSVSPKADPSFSPQSSPRTPVKDPTTPRAMVTAAESGASGNSTISFVMMKAPELTEAR